MIIREFKYSPFKINFKEQFQNSNNTFSVREGLIISLTDEFGYTGYGECSPLSGVSIESLWDVQNKLDQMQSKVLEVEFGNNHELINSQLARFSFPPSLAFGIEQAVLSLLIKQDADYLKNHFGSIKKNIEVNAVVGFDETRKIIEKITRKFNDGFKVFKIKIGRNNPYADLVLVSEIREKFGEDIALRLDVNGAWSSDEAIEYLEPLLQFKIEYVEEPCEYLSSNLRVAEELPINIALDESLDNFDNTLLLIQNSMIEHFVIKPTVLTGVFNTVKLIHEAEKYGKKIIISSSFESSLGKSCLVFLSAITSHNFAHGLDTSNLFSLDVVEDSYNVKGGTIMFDTINYPPDFNFEKL